VKENRREDEIKEIQKITNFKLTIILISNYFKCKWIGFYQSKEMV
jgi:hypothetical protein